MLKESLLKDQLKSESHPISVFLGFKTSDPFRFASQSGGLVQTNRTSLFLEVFFCMFPHYYFSFFGGFTWISLRSENPAPNRDMLETKRFSNLIASHF